MAANPTAPLIVGLGEALFDAFGDDERLGGAPLNVAVHAAALGNRAAVVSRVGDDDRGRRVIDQLKRRGVMSEWVQVDPARPTGVVRVTMRDGHPDYAIEPGAAWDHLEFSESLATLGIMAQAVCFGSLAQRDPVSRAAIRRFVASMPTAVRLFDVNLRLNLYDRDLLEASLKLASAAKLNHEELGVVAAMFGLGGDEASQVAGLAGRFTLSFVALTRGPRGTMVVDRHGAHDAPPVEADTSGGDPVGAGDAVSAALLHGAVRRWPWPRTLALANAIGAHVAGRSGACPPLTDPILRLAAQ